MTLTLQYRIYEEYSVQYSRCHTKKRISVGPPTNHSFATLKTKVGQSESKGWSQLATMHQREILVITA